MTKKDLGGWKPPSDIAPSKVEAIWKKATPGYIESNSDRVVKVVKIPNPDLEALIRARDKLRAQRRAGTLLERQEPYLNFLEAFIGRQESYRERDNG